MDKNFNNAWIGVQNRTLHLMADSMTLSYCEITVHDYVEIDVEFKAHLPYKTLLQILDAGNHLGHGLDFILDCLRRSGIAEFGQCGTYLAKSIEENDERCDERSPVIGAFPSLATY